eukprot:7612089-Pyramimonas_sp.AAC.1
MCIRDSIKAIDPRGSGGFSGARGLCEGVLGRAGARSTATPREGRPLQARGGTHDEPRGHPEVDLASTCVSSLPV